MWNLHLKWTLMIHGARVIMLCYICVTIMSLIPMYTNASHLFELNYIIGVCKWSQSSNLAQQDVVHGPRQINQSPPSRLFLVLSRCFTCHLQRPSPTWIRRAGRHCHAHASTQSHRHYEETFRRNEANGIQMRGKVKIKFGEAVTPAALRLMWCEQTSIRDAVRWYVARGVCVCVTRMHSVCHIDLSSHRHIVCPHSAALIWKIGFKYRLLSYQIHIIYIYYTWS